MGAEESSCFLNPTPSSLSPHKAPPEPRRPPPLRRSGVTAPPSGGRGSAARPPRPPGQHVRGGAVARAWSRLGAGLVGGAGPQLSEPRRRRRRIGLSGGSAAAGAGAQEPTGPGRDGAAAAPRRTHALSGPKLGPAPPAPPAAPVPAGMMCLECASAAAGGAEEEEADAERRRRRRGAQRGAGGGGCCGARAPGATGVAAADDEVQTLSGSVRRAPPGPPSTPSTPSCAAAAKAPGAQQPKPASLGRGRGAAAAILSLGNVLNYLDRYTVAGELVPHPAREPETPPRGTPGNLWSQAPYIQVLRGVPKGPLLRHNWASDAP